MFGISRQAYYKRLKRNDKIKMQQGNIVQLIQLQRKAMPRLGGRKMYHQIKTQLHQLPVRMGRDKLFSFMRENKLLVRRKKKFTKTTNSFHRFRKYPNLIKGIKIKRPEQVWVSDITYIKTNEGHSYLCLITDAYSKQIMGHYLSDNLKTDGPLTALQMAMAKRKYPRRTLIHHSDRGFQYCDPRYTGMLGDNHILPSMTQSYDPYENAIAERVNGILKDEFEIGEGFIHQKHAEKEIKQSIGIYNTLRPHLSCNYLTPAQAHLHGTYKLRKWGRLLTNKHILTKEKCSKKENYDIINN